MPVRPPAGAPAHPPPLVLPGSHFAAVIAWLVAGAAGLVAVAPALAGGDVFAPRVFAVTHAFTLGVVTTAIFGALYQFFPVALGVTLRSVRVGLIGFGLLLAGTLAIVAGFWTWTPRLQGIGWLLLFSAVGCVAWNLLPQRRRSKQHPMVGRYVSLGHSALGIAMFLGLARIGDAAGWWHLERLGVVAAHYHLAAYGFAGLTAVGVGSRMLPMFLVTDVRGGQWQLRWIAPAAAAGLLLFTVGAPQRLAPMKLLGGLLLLGAGALYLHLVGDYFRRRTVARLDHGLSHVAAAFVLLAAAWLTGAALLAGLAPAHDPRWWAAYALVGVTGWLTLFVLGVLYRILPFLLWMHVVGPRSGGGVPVQALSRPRWALASLGLLVSGVALLSGAVAAGHPQAARAGALLFLAGGLVTAVHWSRALLLGRRPPHAATTP